MKAEEIADRFVRSVEKFGELRVRLLKLNALCQRSGVPIEAVLPLLPPDLQQRVKDGQ